MTIKKNKKTGKFVASEKWGSKLLIASDSDRLKAISKCTDLCQAEFDAVASNFKSLI